MGCGGSKEDVATGNTTANGAGRGGKILRRKSTVSANQRPCASSPDGTSIAINNVVKEPASGEPKADEVNVTSVEKLVPVVEEKKQEEVVKKDVADDPAAMMTDAVVVMEQPAMDAEEQLPKSTMTDEAVVQEAKVDEVAVLKEDMCPAPPTNEDGESVGQSIAKDKEANPVDEHNKAVEAAALSESSSSEKKNGDGQTAAVPSKSSAVN